MSDDLTTLDLHAILHDAEQLAKLHDLQRARLDERMLTSGDRPAGMRLSTADPVRRVKAALDPFWNLHIDDGIATRGHMLEDFLEVALLHGEYAPLAGKLYSSQVPIVWHEHGASAFDFVVLGVEGSDRVVSCKSSIKSSKPSSANIAQERRMMSLAGYPAGSVFEVWVINPSTMRATGPRVYTLDQEHIDDARLERDRVSKAYAHFAAMREPIRCDEWNDAEAWRRMFGLRSTSGAFRYPQLDASAAIEKRVRSFMRAREAASLATAELDAAKALIRPHVEEQIEAARALDPEAKKVSAYGADTIVTFSLTANGAMRVDERPLEPDTSTAAA